MTSHCNGYHSKTSVSLCRKETKNWNSSSKTLFYKHCSLGSVKTPSNYCEATDGALSQAVGRIGRSIMSQSILCNYFKVCTKFTLSTE